MAIAFNATSNGTATATSPVTWSHTCTGSNLILVVAVDVYAGATPDCTGVTYNSNALTLIGSKRTSSFIQTSLWYLLSPSTGANTVSVAFTGSSPSCNGRATSYTGVSQSGQPDAVGGNTGVNTVNVTTITDNSWVVGVCMDQANQPTANLTSRGNISTGGGFGNYQDTNGPKTPAGSQTVSWTYSVFSSGLQAASFSPFAQYAPTVTTQSPTLITQTTATGNGNVTSDGGDTVTERGVCWGTSANPDTSGSHSNDGVGGTGSYTSSITGLSENVAYHCRAYAINSIGTSYGSDVQFTSTPLIDKLSASDIGFIDNDNALDTDPFDSGDGISYAVTDTLLNSTTYYWRVRAKDPSGSNTFGAWSSIYSFTTIAGGGGGDLVVDNESSTSSIENIALTQAGGTLSIADESSSSSSDNVVITRNGGDFVIADESSASTIDNITLQFQGNFVIADEASASSIDNIVIVRNGGDFVIADESSVSSVDNVALIGNLQLADEASSSVIDIITITRNGGDFTIDDVSSPSSIENITLGQQGSLFPADESSTPSIDNIILTQAGGTLEIADITSQTSTDNISLIGNLIIEDITSSSSIENIVFEFSEGLFVINDILSTSTVDNIGLIGELIVENINSPPTIDNVTLVLGGGTLTIEDINSASSVQNITLLTAFPIVPDELKKIILIDANGNAHIGVWTDRNVFVGY